MINARGSRTDDWRGNWLAFRYRRRFPKFPGISRRRRSSQPQLLAAKGDKLSQSQFDGKSALKRTGRTAFSKTRRQNEPNRSQRNSLENLSHALLTQFILPNALAPVTKR